MNAVIFDPPHGVDILGKASPDEAHKEWLWCRERLINIQDKLLRTPGLKFDLYAPFIQLEKEIPRLERVRKYNDISKDYLNTFAFALHNNAFGEQWGRPSGIEVWTSRGDDGSDNIATSYFHFMQNKMPGVKFRSAYWLSKGEVTRDPDWEKDFTILAGNRYIKPTYDAILVEHLFMTNKNDVLKLQDPVHNEYFENNVVEWLQLEFN